LQVKQSDKDSDRLCVSQELPRRAEDVYATANEHRKETKISRPSRAKGRQPYLFQQEID